MRRRRPLRAEDALFLHAQTPLLCQQVGAVVLLDAGRPGSPGFSRDDFLGAMAERLRAVPELRWRLERPRSRWRRPYWVPDEDMDVAERIGEVTVGEGSTPGAFSGAVDAFFTQPCDPYRTPWEMRLVRGLPDGRTAVLVKVHHTLGDGHVIIAALTRLFDDAGLARGDDPPRSPRSWGAYPPPHTPLAQAIRGLCHLALAGGAPASSLCGPFRTGRRQFVPVALPARDVARAARALHAGIADLLVASVAEALGRLLNARGEETAGRVLRVAVPRAWPAAGRGGRPPGNRCAAINLDVPVGPLSPAGRLAAIQEQVGLHLRQREPDGAALVLRAMNLLPPPVQRRAAAAVYTRRWFNVLVSVFPGDRRRHQLLGRPAREVYPVLPLADGVGLAIGTMTWERSLSVGILADAALVPDADKLAAELADAVRNYCRIAT
ncbi:MAG TPA: wax ester/triacylglycerol synthase domain-containing protein [Streptosporangiaceae bacterium]|nr:wax ester/triacylglycerol synthase domain-containing protein [Streptosporangiaceae bacterium]